MERISQSLPLWDTCHKPFFFKSQSSTLHARPLDFLCVLTLDTLAAILCFLWHSSCIASSKTPPRPIKYHSNVMNSCEVTALNSQTVRLFSLSISFFLFFFFPLLALEIVWHLLLCLFELNFQCDSSGKLERKGWKELIAFYKFPENVILGII